VPAPDPGAAERHLQLHAAITAGVVRSAHDLAEGGLAVAAAELALGGRLGLRLSAPGGGASRTAAGGGELDRLEVLFGEGPGRYLVEVDPSDRERFAELVPSAALLGSVTTEPVVQIGSTLSVTLPDIATAFGTVAAAHVAAGQDDGAAQGHSTGPSHGAGQVEIAAGQDDGATSSAVAGSRQRRSRSQGDATP
jgi:hypothetical protein